MPWEWKRIWTGADPEPKCRTTEAIRQDAIIKTAKAEATRTMPSALKINQAEYVTLLRDRAVDFIYEAGHIQRPTFMGLKLEITT